MFLDQQQKDFFWKNGYLVVPNVVDNALLKKLQDQFSEWTEQSREHIKPYGNTINNKPRFDLEPSHSKTKPALRRVNAPIEISEAYLNAMTDSNMTQSVVDLIGPNVKFHHSKINAKLPGGHTAVKWHQDFSFTPHSNDDLVTALLMVDEVTEQNGPLQVIPGSHQGEIHNLWHEDVFTGSVDQKTSEQCAQKAITCTGDAGSVCLMHTRLLHGSKINASNARRTLFICVYSAEDAIPFSPNPMPNKFEGKLVSGQHTGKIRTTPYELRLPQLPDTASFFDQQAKIE